MTRDERTRDTMGHATDTMGHATHPIDDDDVARIVRDVATGWAMPPVRLDQPGWRERIRSPRELRGASIKGWFGRLGQAATGAIALTVVAAVVAVYLTGPLGPGTPNHTNGPSAPASTQAPDGTPLPKLYTSGALPSAARVIVQTEDGQFAIADLSTGTLGTQVTASSYASQLRRAPNGDLVCLCTSTDGLVYGQNTHMKVSLERFDASGKVVATTVVVDATGAPDPRHGAVPEQPGHVSAWTSFSTDGRFAYVGWSARAHPDWTSGVVVVALDDGTIVQRLDLPATSDGTPDEGVYVDAPRVVGQSGNRVVINRPGYGWSPVDSSNAHYYPGSEVFAATLSGATLTDLGPLTGAADCGDGVNLAGPLPGGGTWLSCPRSDGSVLTTIRRLNADGSKAGDASVSSALVDGSLSVVSPDGTRLYVWNPLVLELSRVDLATGATTKAKAPAATSASSPLTAFGRWLAPPTLAKMFLQPGVAISPDGSRLFGIGIVGDPAARDFSGSAGVLVFDTEAMTSLGRWEPTADYVSVAMSADGSLLYAAGLPGVNAAGTRTGQQASITVFNASDGSIRLIAGQLGVLMLTFADSPLK